MTSVAVHAIALSQPAAVLRWALPALLLVAAGAARAQLSEGIKIQGRVVYAQTLEPAENVMVELHRLGMLQERIYTESRGEFEFTRLVMTEYVLRVRHAGYLPVERMVNMNVEVGGRGSVFNVTLLLEPDLSAKAAPQAAPALSARELKVPAEARHEFEKGYRELMERKNPAASVEHFRKAIERHRDYDEAYVQLALAYFQQRQRANALRTLSTAVEVYPRNARAFALLGKVLIDTNQVEPAQQALEEALAIDETMWGAHADLASLLLFRKELDPALLHARRALELNSEAPLTHVLLATVLKERQEYEEAVEVMDEFLRKFPQGKLADEIRKQRAELRKLAQQP